MGQDKLRARLLGEGIQVPTGWGGGCGQGLGTGQAWWVEWGPHCATREGQLCTGHCHHAFWVPSSAPGPQPFCMHAGGQEQVGVGSGGCGAARPGILQPGTQTAALGLPSTWAGGHGAPQAAQVATLATRVSWLSLCSSQALC